MMKILAFFLLFVCNRQVNLLPVGRNLLDLSYLYDDKVMYFPGVKPFRLENVFSGNTNNDSGWLAFNNFCGPEHGGTHMDAPYHFYEKGWKLDEIPFDRFMAPAVVVNISSKALTNPNAPLEVADLEAWESEHGTIPNGSVVLVYSGHGTKWGNESLYLGIDKLEPIDIMESFKKTKMNFPGIGVEAADWLVKNRDIVGMGTDTVSLDVGNATTYPAHYKILGNNIYGLENVANLEQMPPSGAVLYILPMKIKNGSGAPTRILARLPSLLEQEFGLDCLN